MCLLPYIIVSFKASVAKIGAKSRRFFLPHNFRETWLNLCDISLSLNTWECFFKNNIGRLYRLGLEMQQWFVSTLLILLPHKFKPMVSSIESRFIMPIVVFVHVGT